MSTGVATGTPTCSCVDLDVRQRMNAPGWDVTCRSCRFSVVVLLQEVTAEGYWSNIVEGAMRIGHARLQAMPHPVALAETCVHGRGRTVRCRLCERERRR